MSVWMTKSSGRTREYVVLRHTLKGVNHVINGVKFRNGFAVVEKDSKTYRDLKRIPVLRAAKEFPLILLKDLSFITRPSDVKVVFGADVYVEFLKAYEAHNTKEAQESKIQEEIAHVVEHKKCSHRFTSNGKADELCAMDALEQSPSGYCMRHLLQDPRLQEFGIEVPKFIPKKEKQEWREQVSEKLANLKKEGKF